jgi:hypothetical protein
MNYRDVMMWFALAGILLAAPSAKADPISYTEQAVLSGVLDGTVFTDATVTITASGDTADITNPSPGIYKNEPLTGTVTVAGVGTDIFSSFLEVVLEGNNVVGIALTSGAIILTTSEAGAYTGYRLDTSYGPVNGGGLFNADLSYAMDLGSFLLDETTREDRLGSAPSAFWADGPARRVPEPTTLALFGAGLSGFVALRRRRRTDKSI